LKIKEKSNGQNVIVALGLRSNEKNVLVGSNPSLVIKYLVFNLKLRRI